MSFYLAGRIMLQEVMGGLEVWAFTSQPLLKCNF